MLTHAAPTSKVRRPLAALAVAAAVFLWAGAAAPVRADGTSAAQLLDQKAPSIVSLKIVLKIHASRGGQAFDREQKSEVRGTMISPTGLVMYYDGSDQIRA